MARAASRLVFVIAAWFGATAVTAFAQHPIVGTVAKVARITAKVEALDRTARTLTLHGPRGTAFTFRAGPEVRGFDQVRVGDFVVVRYLEAVLVEIKKGESGVRERVETSADGAVRRVTVAAEVVAKDAARRTVTLQGPKQTVALKAHSAEQFKLVQVGDRVEATYTEPAAISIELAVSRPEHDRK